MRLDLQAEINRLLALPNSELETAFLTVVEKPEFRHLDGTWALRLYERSPYIFGDLITQHLDVKEYPEIVEELLRRAENDNQEVLFKALYKQIANRDRWNTDIFQLANTAPDYATIVRGMQLRFGDWAIVAEDVLVTLYKRDPEGFHKDLGNELLHTVYSRLFKLPPGRLEFFRREIGRYNSDSQLYNKLFRRFATQEEWEAEILRLIQARPENIAHQLELRHPDNPNVQLSNEIQEKLVQTFGDAVMPYLRRTSPMLIRETLEQLFQSELSDEELLQKLYEFVRLGTPFRVLTPYWTTALYQRNLEYFSNFIVWYADTSAENVKELLNLARRDGRYDFYRQLYARHVQEEDWNQQILEVLRSAPSTAALTRELDRLDVQRERMGQHVYLQDQTAARLYTRNGDLFQEFIWRYLAAGTRDYPLLIEAVRERGDMEFFRRVFRKVASSPEWEAEMKSLLQQDIPPEQILEELEKRKPVRTTNINPGILSKFIAKYGEAVLPFFETYIDWTTPTRLNRLLALDIDRAELLRELEAIARRQPSEFARRADLWAEPLYKLSPEFFGTFLSRYLTWEAKEVAQSLLKRMESDGHDKLFNEVYSRFYHGHEWQTDIARMAGSGLGNEALNAALKRRTNGWSTLPDDLAAGIYTREPDLFRDFVIQHIRAEYGRQTDYPKLRKAAEGRGDKAVLEAIKQKTNSSATWQEDMQALLLQDVPDDQIVSELTRRMPRDYWDIRDMSILAKFIEKYGDSVMPFMFTDRVSNTRSDKTILKAVERYTSKANYWRYVFSMQHADRMWKEGLEHLLSQPLNEYQFRIELSYLTPDEAQRWQRWQLDVDTAAKLYQRYPESTRPFIERFLEGYSPHLYKLAQERGDEEFLDFLTYRMLLTINQLVYKAFPVPDRWNRQKPDEAARATIIEIGNTATARFEHLYRKDAQTYVRHAARILSFIEPFGFFSGWQRSSPSEHNTIWLYLTTQYHDAWRQSSAGITELLESPNIHVQLIALDILSKTDANAAQRVVENLPAFRTLLLSNVRKATKRKVLTCLKAAAQVDRETAQRILPVLRAAMNFNARRAIPDEITAAYVRLEETYAD
jgi:hypothetical protein